MKALPPLERLNELFIYNPLTGIVTRKRNTSPTARKGDIVGTDKEGHLRVFIDRQAYMLHRIVWMIHTGEDPFPYEIDHINRRRNDNRIDNLRKVTTQDNLKNKSLYPSNKTGYAGVLKRGKRYQASVKRDNKTTYLGHYDTALEAHLSREHYLNEIEDKPPIYNG